MDNRITLKTLNVDLTAFYGKMVLDVKIYQTRKTKKSRSRTSVFIEDASDSCHENPCLEWCGDGKFKFHFGRSFGGQDGQWPESNIELRALAKDRSFAKWFKDSIYPVVRRLTRI